MPYKGEAHGAGPLGDKRPSAVTWRFHATSGQWLDAITQWRSAPAHSEARIAELLVSGDCHFQSQQTQTGTSADARRGSVFLPGRVRQGGGADRYLSASRRQTF